ncbi:MAG: methyltransferase domain-containing protein [Candidatus Pacearchaeota archaeon]
MNQTNKIKNWWEKRSGDYLKENSVLEINYGPGVPNENKLKIIGNVMGKNILDLGCGGGQASVIFAKKGAKVIGIDLSKKQVKFAKEFAEKNDVKVDFMQGNFQKLSTIKSNTQDLVFSSWSFLYSPDIKILFKEVHRVLKKGGLFIFSQDHPFFHCFEHQTLKINQSYFKSGRVKGINFIAFRRTISEIFDALREAGFNIERIIEPQSSWKKPLQKKDKMVPTTINKYNVKMVPTTIIFKARKF